MCPNAPHTPWLEHCSIALLHMCFSLLGMAFHHAAVT